MKTQNVPPSKSTRPNSAAPRRDKLKARLAPPINVEFSPADLERLKATASRMGITPEQLILTATEKAFPSGTTLNNHPIASALPNDEVPNDELHGQAGSETEKLSQIIDLEAATGMATAFMELVTYRYQSSEHGPFEEPRESWFFIGLANLHVHVEKSLLAATAAAIKEIQTHRRASLNERP